MQQQPHLIDARPAKASGSALFAANDPKFTPPVEVRS